MRSSSPALRRLLKEPFPSASQDQEFMKGFVDYRRPSNCQVRLPQLDLHSPGRDPFAGFNSKNANYLANEAKKANGYHNKNKIEGPGRIWRLRLIMFRGNGLVVVLLCRVLNI